jgi:predicted small secreted protein
MEVHMRHIAALMLIVWVAAIAGCNTMRGLGQDMERAGEAIQRKADR